MSDAKTKRLCSYTCTLAWVKLLPFLLFCSAAESLSSKVKRRRRHRTVAHRRKSSKKISSSLHASRTVDERILHGSLSLSHRFRIKSIDVHACVRAELTAATVGGGCKALLMKAILCGKFTLCTGILLSTPLIHVAFCIEQNSLFFAPSFHF
jgi:hypothetical protein